MNNIFVWLCIVILSCLTVYNKASEYRPPEKPKQQGYLSAPAGTWNKPDGTKAAIVILFFEDGTTGWSAQPIEEKPVMELK
jgi:hypothetical protein